MENPLSEHPLGAFHAELLDFLQRETERRSEEEGFSLESDPSLQQFQEALKKALSPLSADEDLPLCDILDNYQRLFEERGPLHIERKLFEALSLKEFAAVGLERDFPKIYRGLPRLYRRNCPTESHIKKNFAHLPTLIRFAVEKALLRLYEKSEIFSGAKVALFTWVIPDGWGDYGAAEEVARLLMEQFPALEVKWVALIPKKFSVPPRTQALQPYLLYYEEDSPPSLSDEKALAMLRSADLVLQLPTYYPRTQELIEELGHNRFYSIGEYGFVESSWFHPRTGNRSLGLHFLEKGILIRDPENRAARFSDLRCAPLLQWLFAASHPGSQEEEGYCTSHRFYLAYLTTPLGTAVYLHALFESLAEDTKGIDLCIPDLRGFIQWIEHQKKERRPILEREFGISAMEVYFGEEKHFFPLREKGKRVRIFSPGPLSPADFRLLLQLSGDFVAVRGNQSFSEAISMQKGFFYDGREHSRYFLKDLLALAENRIAAHPKTLIALRGMAKAFLHNLSPQEGEWVDEVHFQEKEPWLEIALEIGEAMKDSDAVCGYRKLGAILCEEHSFCDFLFPFIRKELYHRRNPEIARAERVHMDLFTTESTPFSSLVRALRDLIAQGRS